MAPTPVMPKAATAVMSPPSGSRNDNPETTSDQEKYWGSLNIMKAQLTVRTVKQTTSPMEIFSTTQ